jgi:hypothetical protein
MFFLHQLATSEHQEIVVLEIIDTPVFENGEGVSFLSNQSRFIGDDLETLFGIGLLSRSQNRHGHFVYKLTRTGMAFLKASSWTPVRLEESP